MSAEARAPRVLLSGVVLAQPMGGVRRHNAELLPRVARLLRERGGELCLLASRDGLPFAVPDARIESSSVRADSPLRRAMQEGAALRALQDAASARGLPFDLVHSAHFPLPRGIGRVTLTVHDLRSLQLEHTPLSRRLVARGILGGAFARAALIFTVSETVRQQLERDFRLPAHKLRLLPNAADHFQVLPRAPEPDAPLLHVGHLEPRKNLELLLHALALDPSLPRLLLAGAEKRGEGARLLELARTLGLAARVEWRGPFEEAELPALYSAAACVVLPSLLEGFGIPVLEAQRARVPLAISSAGALPEVAGAQVPSFDPRDPAGCARAIHAALGRAARELEADARAAEAHSWDASAEEWVRAWSELLADAPS